MFDVSPEDVAVTLIGVAAKVSPIIADFFHGAVAAMHDHPIAKRVEEVLPAMSRSREVERDLERNGS